jgi:putative transposase
MEKRILPACARYVELNPVRAGLVRRARDWRWSSARAHLKGADDRLVRVRPLLDLAPDWSAFLRARPAEAEYEAIRAAGRTGRPLGSARFIARMETRLGRPLARQKPGPKPKDPGKVPG